MTANKISVDRKERRGRSELVNSDRSQHSDNVHWSYKSCIAAYIYIYKYMQKHNPTYYTNFNERTNTLLIKTYLSHFILERVDVGCV